VLRVRLVHGDDRVLQRAVLRHRLQPDHAGRRLLRAADDLVQQIGALLVDLGDQVRPVVHGELRTVVQRLVQVPVVRLVVLTLDRIGGDAVLHRKRRSHVVLRTERVAGAHHQVGAAVPQRDREVRGLRRDVQATGEAHAPQRLLFGEALADRADHGHLARRPLDAPDALFRQPRVANITLY